jgi:hypothetical protein
MKALIGLVTEMKEKISGLAEEDIINEENIDNVRGKITDLLNDFDKMDFYTDKINDKKTKELIDLPPTLMDMMEKDGLPNGVVETMGQMEELSRNLGESFVQCAQGSEVFEKTAKENEETLKDLGKGTRKVSNGIVSMSEAFMSLAGVVNALK